MQNSMMMFTFSVFIRKSPIWANLIQKNNNIVSLLVYAKIL